MDFVQAEAAFRLIGEICGVLAFVAMLYLSTRFVSRGRFESLERRVESCAAQTTVVVLETRVEACERRQEGMASAQDLSRHNTEMRLTISKLEGVTNVLAEQIKGWGEACRRLDEGFDWVRNYLTEQTKK